MTACTGLTARWCPVHGDCRCEDVDGDPRCPLHSPISPHPVPPGRGAMPFDGWRETVIERDALRSLVAKVLYASDGGTICVGLHGDEDIRDMLTEAELAAARAALA